MLNWRLQVNEVQPKSNPSTPRFNFNRFGSTHHLPHGSADSTNPLTAAMINLPASLEDCHTNVLALTELSGLKWRRLTTPDTYQYGTDLDQDPILSAYSRCVRAGVVCTWRRRQRQNESSTQIENVALRLDTPKELWIFWYTDEPELVKVLEKENGLITPDDTEFPDLTIKYETRTQFFKALHNNIESNMLKSGYVRFGRWFARPLDEFAVSPDCAMPSHINGLRFEFSVQGENNVCATIKNQYQPPILRLSPKHLQSATKPMPVILAPWSIRAQLLPQQPLREVQNLDQLSSSLNSSGFSLLNSSIQQQTQLPEEVQTVVEEQWSQWAAMLSMASLPSTDDQNEQNENVAPSTSGKQLTEKLPRFVAIEVDGTKMFYPTCFIGVLPQELSDLGNKFDQRGLMSDDLDLNDSLVGFSQDSQIDLLEIRRQKGLVAKKKETFVPETLRHSRKSHVGVRIARRSFEDAALAAPPVPLPAPAPSNSGPPALQRMKTETGLHLNMPSTSVATVSTNASDDLRWNYFDYLRKEYCYCAMCSAGGNQPEGKPDLDSKSLSSLNQPSTSSAPYVFHRSNFNDRLGGYGTDPSLFSPPQNSQKVASPEQTQKELDFLRQLDEKERQHGEHSERKVPIFARTIATTQRTAIPSDRLNFASVQECNFNNLFKRHLNAIGFPIEHQQQDISDEFEAFTPITCVTPDPEANQDFNNPDNHWTERIRNFNYPYHPQKTDFITEESYHVREQREKPIGPRLKSPSENANKTPFHLESTPTQPSTSILKSLLDAPDDEDESYRCYQPMQSRGTSPRSIRRDEREWQKCVGEALQQRRRTPSRKWMSEREKELRRWHSQKELQAKRQVSTAEEPIQPKWQSQTSLMHERRASTSELNGEHMHSALRERLLSPSMSINLSRSAQNPEEPMDVDRAQSNSNQSRRQSLIENSAPHKKKITNGMFDPLAEGEESELVYKGPVESLFYGEKVKERHLMCENVKLVGKPFIRSVQSQKELTKTNDEYPILRRMIQEDLVDVEDPKTPIANLNSSSVSHLSHQTAHSQQDYQQVFTSAHANDVHSILSPPASNEQVDGNPLALQQQHTPGDKNQPQQAQSLVSVGQNSLMLHSGGWSTAAVSANNIHDSLNIIYPTPPTPLQQFSPLNTNPILPEDPQAKRRRLVECDEYSEPEQEDDIGPKEQDQTSKTVNTFLSVENLAADLFKLKAPTSPIYHPKKRDLPPHSERFNGDLLDEQVDPKRKLRWLKHLKREPVGRRQKLKEDLKKRTSRKEIALPPEYVSQFKNRRLMTPNGAMIAFNPHDKHRLARNAIELAAARRKPINCYGNSAVVRLNNAYLNEKRHWEQRNFAHKQDSNSQMIRQFSTGSMSGMHPMQSQQQMMMYSQQGGANRQFNSYLMQQQSFSNSGPMTPQQQMMMSSHNPQMMNPAMGRPGNQQMHPNGASPGYPSAMQQNFQKIPLQQQRLGGIGSPMSAPRYPTPSQQPSQQQMLGYFNDPSPASSLGSNPPSQIDPQHGNQQGSQRFGPGSVHSNHAPLPFGSPGIQMNSGPGNANFQQQRTPSMPPSVTANNFDVASVANQSVFSVEGPTSALHGQRSQIDQAKVDEILSLFQNCRSHLIAVLMKDTIMDLHYDSVFDACPICSCNANIRSAELGLYVKVPDALNEVLRIQQRQQQDQTFKVDYWSGLMLGNASVPCSCGFSAVRHRMLCSVGLGLFGDDVQEAGIVINQFKALGRGNERSYSKKRMLNELMDCLRFLSMNRSLAVCFKQAYYLGDFPSEDVLNKPSQIAASSQNTNYILSRVDIEELDVALRSVVQVARGNQAWGAQGNDGRLKKAPLFHPWGFQIACQIREPKDQECLAVVREVQCVLERSMKEVRGVDPTSQTNIVEGPLTWRSLYRKAVKSSQEDDAYKPEQIPQILVSADRDAISTNPQLIHLWEKLSLSPFDQPKDVLYLAVVPDSNVIVEKCKVYLEELSTIYEKSRFGRHVRLSTKDTPRDGIIRVNMKSHSVVNAAAQGLGANSKFNEEDRKLHLKISAFCDQVLAELKAAIVNNEFIFERRAYYETLYRDSLQPNYTSLATSTDSNYMPPPAVPPMIQSPPSILSTASGPASQPLNPMSNPTPTPTSLFSAPNTNQLPSPALSTGDNLMEPLRTPEVSVGTPGDQQTQQIQQQPPSQHLTPEAIEKAIDEMILEDHPLSLPHVIVVYLVNPFTFGSETCSSRVARSAGLFLMKTFNSLLAAMSSRRRPQIQIELINLQTLYDYSSFVADPLREERQFIDDMSRQDKATAYDCLRRVAFSVYSQTRLLVSEQARGAVPSSMTRFGPASAISDILDDLQRRDPPLYFKVPAMPFILAPTEVLGVESANNKIRLLNPAERVLFVAYCLPSDDFLCAAVTDHNGHLADNVIINLHVDQPTNQLRYKNRSQIFDAIHRLWLYIQSVMVMETKNWRLVINRVGKIGHGEFKAWSQILSKNSLRSFNTSFKGRDRGDGLMSAGLDSASSASNCRTCQQTAGTQEVPIVLSACLLSMEAEPNLRLFSSSNSAVDLAVSLSKSKSSTKNSGVAQAQIVDDPSVTHIIAFPISPEIMDAQHGGNQPGGQEDENIFDDLNFNDLMQDDENIDALMGNTEFGDGTREDTTIDHQPMAIGYSVSTAPANDLPDWFWSSCPNMKRQLPVHLKNALHINSSNIHDELSIGQKTCNETFHPLDDSATDALLKYIMKTHNALSWLNVDVANGTRLSCLPVHIQALFRLQRTIDTIYQ